MSKIINIFLRTIIIFALANIVCCSNNYLSYYGRTRLPRYSTCTSCNREWADAMLSAPWYPENNYDEVQFDKKFMDNNEKFYNKQINPHSSLISRSLNSFNKYEHPTKKRNNNPTMLYSDGRKFYQRDEEEDSFENVLPIKFDPYLTSKTSIDSTKQDGRILNQYPFMFKPKSESNVRSFNPNSYQSQRKFSVFDDQRMRNLMKEKDYNSKVIRLNRDDDDDDDDDQFISFNQKVQSFVQENNKNDDYYKPSRKFTVVYRADHNDKKDDNSDLFKQSKISQHYSESFDKSFNLDSNSHLTRNPSSRDKIIYDNNNNNNNNIINWLNKLSSNDYLTRNYYNNMIQKSDVSKIIDNDRLLSDKKEIVSFNQQDSDKSLESYDDKDYNIKVSTKNDDHISDQQDIINNEEEKLRSMQKVVEDDDDNDDSSIKEKTSFKFDPNFLDDIEYPSAEFTESTNTDEFTESSMMTEN